MKLSLKYTLLLLLTICGTQVKVVAQYYGLEYDSWSDTYTVYMDGGSITTNTMGEYHASGDPTQNNGYMCIGCYANAIVDNVAPQYFSVIYPGYTLVTAPPSAGSYYTTEVHTGANGRQEEWFYKNDGTIDKIAFGQSAGSIPGVIGYREGCPPCAQQSAQNQAFTQWSATTFQNFQQQSVAFQQDVFSKFQASMVESYNQGNTYDYYYYFYALQVLTGSNSNTPLPPPPPIPPKPLPNLNKEAPVTTDVIAKLPASLGGNTIYVAPNGAPFMLPSDAKVGGLELDISDFANGALYSFYTADGKHYAADESFYIRNSSAGEPAFRGYYEVVNGRCDLTKPYIPQYPYITSNTLPVVRLRKEITSTGCRIIQELVSYPIYQGRPSTIPTTGDIYQSQVTEIEASTLIPGIQSNSASVKCPATSNTSLTSAVELDGYAKTAYHTSKLMSDLNLRIKNSVKIYLFDCATGKVKYIVTKSEYRTLATAAEQDAETAKLNSQFNNGSFGSDDQDIVIKGCIQGGKWQYDVKLNPNKIANPHPKMQAVLNEVQQEIKRQVDEEVQKLKSVTATSNGESFDVGNGESFGKISMDIFRTITAIYDVGKDIINEGKMPERIWDGGKRANNVTVQEISNAHGKSPFSMPTVISGATDQLIDEATGAIQLVKTGLEIIRHPIQTGNTIWNGVKSIDKDKVFQLISTSTGISEYTAGGDRAKHQAGKHATQLAMFAFGAARGLSKGADVIENAGDVSRLVKVADNLESDLAQKIKNFDQNVSNNIYKSVSLGENTQELAETVIRETADAEQRLARKYTWTEVQALFQRGNDFNAKARSSLPPWYNYHEVTIEHPTLKYPDGSPKRFRLDSYNPSTDIVSRKATDLANIQQSTFEGYLRELVSKYPNGAKIVTPNSAPTINGQLLSGSFKLEIPASNANFAGLSNYRQIANNFTHNGQTYHIEIVLKPE